jgi:cbb3-type cytochrome oxidase maturation protein
MQIIFFMVGVSLLMALIFFGAFLWSMKNGQNDDLYTPSIRILVEDEDYRSKVTEVERSKGTGE